MITVEMPQDIRKFEPKFIGQLTLRQTVCLTIGVAVALPVALLLPVAVMYKFIVAAVIVIPFMMAGWLKPEGMNFEVYAVRMIYYNFLTPKVRKVKIKNYYRASLNRVKKAEENKKLKSMSDRERKRYLKKKKENIIKRSNKRMLKVYQ
ncbi:MAG: PrgI family protein [Candidatus Weimeria sp.]